MAFYWSFIVSVFSKGAGDIREVNGRLRMSSECLRSRTQANSSKGNFFSCDRHIVKALSGKTSLKKEILS